MVKWTKFDSAGPFGRWLRTRQHLPNCIKTGKSKEPWTVLRPRFSEYRLIAVVAVVVIIITTVAALPLIAAMLAAVLPVQLLVLIVMLVLQIAVQPAVFATR